MKISFIVPMYNESSTISDCINSIIAEADAEDQIIIIDNGSTDNSVSIVLRYNRVLLVEKPKITIGAVRNVGASIATGEVLAFIDADCVLSKNWRNHVVKTFDNLNIAACGSKYDLPMNPNWIESAWFSHKITTAGLANYINSGNLVVRRDIFLAVDGFDEKLITGEDAEFGLRLNKKGFIIWEDPEIKAIHLGNPKNLKGFYMKQRWHGLGMLGTLRISWFDKPFIMTLAFMFCTCIALLFLFYWNVPLNIALRFLIILSCVLVVPIVTAMFRVRGFNNISYLPCLVFLYFIYFAARSEALFRLIVMRKVKNGIVLKFTV